MKISYNWLKEYLDFDYTPEQLKAILVDLGLEVEGIEPFETIRGGLKGIVVGEVLSCGRHPNADKLSVTTVEVGTGTPLPIVCGAPNVAAGQKVLVAVEGAQVFHGTESFTIKKTKLRGEPSEGMICAEDEIGLGASHDGIMVLPPSAVVGTPASEYFNVKSDSILEIGLTPNRIDSASHYGVARDLAAWINREVRQVSLKKPDVSGFAIAKKDFPVAVTVEDAEGCLRYSGVTLTGVRIGPSPEWLQNSLKAIGLNPINNVVDITNFVLHECGQPLHAFDADALAGHEIIVKKAREGEKFTTLDGAEHTLSAADMMICDQSGAVAMAGVFGGLHSGVSDKTTNVFIESAYFNPVTVRRTARKFGISTDSSFRFERGTDPNNTLFALKRAALLMQELAGGTISSEVVDVYPVPVKDFMVQVSLQRMHKLIGKEIGKEAIIKILSALEITLVAETDDLLTLAVPPYRVDVQREADIVEEILRIHGYNSVVPDDIIKSAVSYTSKPDKEKLTGMVSDFLVSCGFNEIMCNSLTSAPVHEQFLPEQSGQLVRILNPLSSDLGVMRQSLLFGGLETVARNINRQRPNLRLYELGNCYFRTAEPKGQGVTDRFTEEYHLSMLLTGDYREGNWYSAAQASDYYLLKAEAEKVMRRLGITVSTLSQTALEHPLLSECFVWKRGNAVVAYAGVVKPALCKHFDVRQKVFYADLNWKVMLDMVAKNTIRHQELPKFPEVERDLALLLDASVSFDRVMAVARKTEKNLLKSVSLFDVYEGEKIGAGKVSYAVRFVLQDATKTLADSDIEAIMNKLIAAFAKEIGAALR